MFVIGALIPWNFAVLLTLIWPTFSFICITCFCPESPVWLLNKGRDELAEKSLLSLRSDEGIVSNELKRIKSAIMQKETEKKDNLDQAIRSRI